MVMTAILASGLVRLRQSTRPSRFFAWFSDAVHRHKPLSKTGKAACVFWWWTTKGVYYGNLYLPQPDRKQFKQYKSYNYNRNVDKIDIYKKQPARYCIQITPKLLWSMMIPAIRKAMLWQITDIISTGKRYLPEKRRFSSRIGIKKRLRSNTVSIFEIFLLRMQPLRLAISAFATDGTERELSAIFSLTRLVRFRLMRMPLHGWLRNMKSE